MAINSSLSSGVVPNCMKIAKVIPLYKAKDQQIISNYRPISLLPVLSKVLEKTIYTKLAKYLELHTILYKSQYGFRRGHSTVHGVAEFVQHNVHSLDNKQSTISVLLDLSKAFDTINHSILLHKLHYYGIRGIALNWFRSYLSNRRQFVSCNGHHSVIRHITCGVPQGSVLGPLLFLIYMNDLPTCLTYTQAVLFADDTTIYTSSDNIIDLYHNINVDLSNLVDWFRSNKLALNTTKTNFMLFTNSNNIPANQFIKIDTDIIERRNCCKFLGLMIDHKLTWSEHISYTKSKISRSLYAMNRLKHMIGKQYLKTLYDSLVHSYLSYGVILWGGTYSTHLNAIRVSQKKALRCIYNSKYNTHTHPLFQDSKILNLMTCTDLRSVNLYTMFYMKRYRDLFVMYSMSMLECHFCMLCNQ